MSTRCLAGGEERRDGMAREVVAIDCNELGGGMCAERARSRGGDKLTSSCHDAPIACVPADVLQLAVGLQAMSTSSTIPEGFRNWLNGVDTTIPGICRSNQQHMAAAGRLGSQRKKSMTNADDARDLITEGHSVVEQSRVTNSEEASSSQIHVVGQSQPHHSGLTRPHSDTGKHHGAEQLTVFYAGMVNVYDKVPLDKAQAIMVLAGREGTWAGASNDTNFVSGSSATHSVALTQLASRARFPSPQVTTEPKCVPIVNWPKAIATQGELPQARKASLARFLERRRYRLRGGPYTSTTHNVSMRLSRAALNSSWLSSSQRQSLSQY